MRRWIDAGASYYQPVAAGAVMEAGAVGRGARIVLSGGVSQYNAQQARGPSVGAQWTFLSDPGRTIQKDLDIAEYTASTTTR
jgi:NADPH-dependent curcumin reductase CurA